MRTFLFMGPPGSGKGTHAARLQEVIESTTNLNCAMVSVGRFLRKFTKEGWGSVGTRSYLIGAIDNGDLVKEGFPVAALMKVILDENEYDVIIADGSCRSILETKVVVSTLTAIPGNSVEMVVMHIPQNEAEKRILDRAKESGRADDSDPETVRKRVLEYYNGHTETLASIEMMRNSCNIITHDINGNRPMKEVFNDIRNICVRC